MQHALASFVEDDENILHHLLTHECEAAPRSAHRGRHKGARMLDDVREDGDQGVRNYH